MENGSSIEKLHDAVVGVCRGRKSQGRRYPDELRCKIVAFADSERTNGVSLRSTAKALGLSYPTLLGWMQAPPRGFRSVEVKPVAPNVETAKFCVTTPQGHKVEGLDRDDVAFLLRSLE